MDIITVVATGTNYFQIYIHLANNKIVPTIGHHLGSFVLTSSKAHNELSVFIASSQVIEWIQSIPLIN